MNDKAIAERELKMAFELMINKFKDKFCYFSAAEKRAMIIKILKMIISKTKRPSFLGGF